MQAKLTGVGFGALLYLSLAAVQVMPSTDFGIVFKCLLAAVAVVVHFVAGVLAIAATAHAAGAAVVGRHAIWLGMAATAGASLVIGLLLVVLPSPLPPAWALPLYAVGLGLSVAALAWLSGGRRRAPGREKPPADTPERRAGNL